MQKALSTLLAAAILASWTPSSTTAKEPLTTQPTAAKVIADLKAENERLRAEIAELKRLVGGKGVGGTTKPKADVVADKSAQVVRGMKVGDARAVMFWSDWKLDYEDDTTLTYRKADGDFTLRKDVVFKAGRVEEVRSSRSRN